MEQLLYWYSNNNSTIIQSLIVVIGVTLCFFIYKILFGQNQKNKNNEEGPQKSTVTVESIETKINQLLESQSKNKSSKNDVDSEIPATSEEAVALIEKIQAENVSLKKVIKDQEALSINYTRDAVSPNGAASGSAGASAASKTVDVSNYEKEIADLKNRLSDYEVISEDISDLHKLREENQKLKDQIQNVQKPATASTEVQTAVPPAEANAASAKVISANDIESELTENNAVTDEEKDLIEQFEKNKGS
jgi:hypothetical protein